MPFEYQVNRALETIELLKRAPGQHGSLVEAAAVVAKALQELEDRHQKLKADHKALKDRTKFEMKMLGSVAPAAGEGYSGNTDQLTGENHGRQ